MEVYHADGTHASIASALSGMDSFQDRDLAGKNGPNTEKIVRHILENKPHPSRDSVPAGNHQAGKAYSPERLEAACILALHIKGYSYKSIESILKQSSTRKRIHRSIKQFYAESSYLTSQYTGKGYYN